MIPDLELKCNIVSDKLIEEVQTSAVASMKILQRKARAILSGIS
jgi:hypothetical protein